MSDIRPFRGLRPRTDMATLVASPPYDVMNSAEAKAMAEGNEFSFLHVIKPEIDLESGINPYDDRVYAKGAENLQHLIKSNTLIKEEKPCFYIYQQKMGDHIQTGVVAGASVDEYEVGKIKKHEFTRPDKEDDRTRHLNSLNANTGPVFLTYAETPEINLFVDKVRARTPEYDFTSDDGIGHTLWVVTDDAEITALAAAFKKVPHLYVADGHHRSASATRVRKIRQEANPGHSGQEEYNYFLTVIFPDTQMKILPYNRVVLDLNGLSESDFLASVEKKFTVSPATSPEPAEMRTFCMFLNDKWYHLAAKDGSYPADDPVASLDCAIMQDNLLSPILGIDDPRTNKRVDFIGGIRGTSELEKRCREGAAVAFSLYPTSIDQLMSVADADKVMPPKSTWFEPKLRSGLITRPLEG